MTDTRKRALDVANDERRTKRQKPLDKHIFALFSFDFSVTAKGGALRAQVDCIETVPREQVKATVKRTKGLDRSYQTRGGRRGVSLRRVVPIKVTCDPKYMLLRVQFFKQENEDGEWKLSFETQSMAVAPTRLEMIELLGQTLYWKRRDERAYAQYMRQVKKMQRNCTMQALEVGPCWFKIIKLD
ncbi:MAG: hypothetical protein CMP20_01680 [Rickettsiales bacterium]|nr:hypothetical protein [Rickettsiales bacterium]